MAIKLAYFSVALGEKLKSDPADLALRRAVGKALRVLRKEHQPQPLSQEHVALEAGVSRSYFGEIERGLHDPGLWTLWRLRKALKVKWSRFMREIESHYSSPRNSKANHKS